MSLNSSLQIKRKENGMKATHKPALTLVLVFFVAVTIGHGDESLQKGSRVRIDPQEEPLYETIEGKTFQVEMFGGWASLKPADLNLRAAYDTQYLANLRDYYTSYYPDTEQSYPSGNFKSVESSLPSGFRVRYRINRLISFSLAPSNTLVAIGTPAFRLPAT